MSYTINVNGVDHSVDAEGDTALLWVLRDVLGMTGTKFGCALALCGACTVHLDGRPVRACMLPIADALGKRIRTIEGAMAAADEGADKITASLKAAWLDLEVVQCGYCQPGQIMSAAALLAEKSDPSDADIDHAMSGNICRCGTYPRIRAAIKRAAQQVGGTPVAVTSISMAVDAAASTAK